MRRTPRLPVFWAAFLLIAGLASVPAPAWAGELLGASANTANTYASAANSSYTWNGTTSTAANLSEVRAGVPAGTDGGDRYVYVPGLQDNDLSTPDSPAVSVTGDLDIRVKAQLPCWTCFESNSFMSHWDVNSANRSFTFRQSSATNGLALIISTNGSNNLGTAQTAAVNYAPNTTKWVRVTLDANDGAGGRVSTFYDSDDGITWNVVGAPIVQAGAVTLFDSSAPLEVSVHNLGINAGVAPGAMTGKLYFAELRNGINGPVVASMDPNLVAPGSTSWTAATGELWSLKRGGLIPIDIRSDLVASGVSGLPAGGLAYLSLCDAVAGYAFTPASVGGATAFSVTLSGFITTNAPGTYLRALSTYDDSVTPVIVDAATVSLEVHPNPALSVVGVGVDPSLTLVVSGRSAACNGTTPTAIATAANIPLGRPTTTSNVSAAQDVVVSTNAASGYVVFVRQSGPLSDGLGHTIAAVSGTDAAPAVFPAPGAEAFGYTTSEATLGLSDGGRFSGGRWAALTAAAQPVSFSATGTVTNDTVCVAYQVGVSSSTLAGAYATVLTYSAVPTF